MMMKFITIKTHISTLLIFSSLIITFLCSCRDLPTQNNINNSIQIAQVNDTVIILTYGGLFPPYYKNAQDIIAKKYKINYIQVSGCVVWQSLIDSVEIENNKAVEKLANQNPSQNMDSINMDIQKEYTILKKLDSVIISHNIWKQQGFTYFIKQHKHYNAYHFTYKNKRFHINQIADIDSLTLKINNTSIPFKDSLIKNLSYLHYQNN